MLSRIASASVVSNWSVISGAPSLSDLESDSDFPIRQVTKRCALPVHLWQQATMLPDPSAEAAIKTPFRVNLVNFAA
jgi:hypothetical protein